MRLDQHCRALDNAGWYIQQGRDLTMKGSTVRMTRKIIYQPVIHTVWNIETCQFLKKRKVADRIKRFTEIKCNEELSVISAFKLSVQIVCMRASAPENRSRFRNDRIALSMNSCVKSFHIDSKAFSVRQCCLFLAYIVSIAFTHDNPVDLNISEVILKSELKFNYLFIL